jgi:hypothetical protein
MGHHPTRIERGNPAVHCQVYYVRQAGAHMCDRVVQYLDSRLGLLQRNCGMEGWLKLKFNAAV